MGFTFMSMPRSTSGPRLASLKSHMKRATGAPSCEFQTELDRKKPFGQVRDSIRKMNELFSVSPSSLCTPEVTGATFEAFMPLGHGQWPAVLFLFFKY